MNPKPRILLVDDEQQVLDGLARILRQHFDLVTANSGQAGLEILEKDRSIAVVMSDMRMPVMNGATFLAKARALHPDATRLLLTGQSDVDDAIAAVNEGSIFRFLKKPCPPDVIRGALTAAYEQHRLVIAERELLERTLRGAVQALTDTLALTAPSVFGASTRVKRVACEVASKMGLPAMWQLEIAAMMCQLGAIVLPPGLWERRIHRAVMSAADRAMLDRVPVVTEQLLASIPRLEPVVAIIRHALGAPAEGDVAAQILRAVLEFEDLEAATSATTAIGDMQRKNLHPPAVLEALMRVVTGIDANSGTEIQLSYLREGMVIAADVRTTSGVLIVARGHTVTAGIVERLRNYKASLPSDSVRIAA